MTFFKIAAMAKLRTYLCRTLLIIISEGFNAAAFAQAPAGFGFMPPCPSRATTADLINYGIANNAPDGCDIPVNVYRARIYEMGLCTSMPWSGNSFDRSSCVTTFRSPEGSVVDIAQMSDQPLPDNFSSRPSNGTYGYVYIIQNSAVSISAQYQAATVTYYTTGPSRDSSGNSLYNLNTVGPAVEFVDPIVDCDDTETGTFEGGLMYSYYTDSDLNECAGNDSVVTRRVVFARTAEPIVVTAETRSIEISYGMSKSAVLLFEADGVIDGIDANSIMLRVSSSR
jgi:hypothetical protein